MIEYYCPIGNYNYCPHDAVRFLTQNDNIFYGQTVYQLIHNIDSLLYNICETCSLYNITFLSSKM